MQYLPRWQELQRRGKHRKCSLLSFFHNFIPLAIFHEISMRSNCRIDGSRLFFSHEHKWDDRLDSFVSSCMLMGTEPRSMRAKCR